MINKSDKEKLLAVLLSVSFSEANINEDHLMALVGIVDYPNMATYGT